MPRNRLPIRDNKIYELQLLGSLKYAFNKNICNLNPDALRFFMEKIIKWIWVIRWKCQSMMSYY